ncbi:hypothetical protein EIP91_004351 [Steccherinum ochraceum]|uniref:Uncharacterized protein n=1 Tax=Steccherinum ochraceum TaxID=92696 RepID=A0A4R0RBF4_9APHY|nr:hypothetical protein EIP91_004351 [Steccherinum ochraceum]
MRFTTAFVALAAFTFTSALAAPHPTRIAARDNLQTALFARGGTSYLTVRDVVEALVARDHERMERREPKTPGGRPGSVSEHHGTSQADERARREAATQARTNAVANARDAQRMQDAAAAERARTGAGAAPRPGTGGPAFRGVNWGGGGGRAAAHDSPDRSPSRP